MRLYNCIRDGTTIRDSIQLYTNGSIVYEAVRLYTRRYDCIRGDMVEAKDETHRARNHSRTKLVKCDRLYLGGCTTPNS